MADCPLCTGARGINKKEDFIEHLDSHQEMAMNHDMMFRKFKEYVLAHENAGKTMSICFIIQIYNEN
jgi:hypothetical protein